jgi:GGDEF domain-containing protein
MSLDPATGCWNARSFRELVTATVADCARQGTTAALCYVRVRNYTALTGGVDKAQAGIIRQLLAQVLRRRLPAEGALAAWASATFARWCPAARRWKLKTAWRRSRSRTSSWTCPASTWI